MTSHRFSIDCREEEERFRGLVRFESGERVMAIRADGEAGKSHFLQRIVRICQEDDPKIPASCVDFAVFRGGESLDLLRAVRKGFGRSIDFSQFDELVSNVDMRIWSSASPVGVVDVRGGRFERTGPITNAGVLVQNPQGQVVVTAAEPIQLQDERALEAAREKCREAFFETLAEHCASRPAAIILDTYDQGAVDARAWLEREMCDRIENDNWPQRLAIVLAGRAIPSFEEDWRRYEEHVVLLDGLSQWQPEDIVAGFRDIGFDEPPDALPQIVYFLEQGATPGQLVGLMQLAAARSGARAQRG